MEVVVGQREGLGAVGDEVGLLALGGVGGSEFGVGVGGQGTRKDASDVVFHKLPMLMFAYLRGLVRDEPPVRHD